MFDYSNISLYEQFSEENSVFSLFQVDSSFEIKNPDNQNDESLTTDTILKKGKRGRKANNKERPEHDKSARDNIRRKIQINYLKFLIKFINQIIDELLIKDEKSKYYHFYPLKHEFTKNISKKSFNQIKNTSIGDIFKKNVSPKFKNSEQFNINVYNNIINKNDKFKNILDKKYLHFFDIYYKNIKQIDLSDYGINKIINLSSDIKLYEDLLKTEINNNNFKINNDKYFSRIEKCIKKDFSNNINLISKPIFVVK